jgi:hypothetical protein
MAIYGTLPASSITNISLDVASSNGTGALQMPSGNTAQRLSNPPAGTVRYNTQTSLFESYTGTVWLSGSYLFSNDGSTLSGWTTSGVSVSSGTGNPGYSLLAPGNGSYAYISPSGITSLYNTTIQFDINVSSTLGDFFIGCNSSGAGFGVRLGVSGAWPVGFWVPTSWTTWGGSSGSTLLTAGQWYTCKVQITSGGTMSLYLNGTFIASQTVTLNGTYIGIAGDGGGGNQYFDNIYIYPGIV